MAHASSGSLTLYRLQSRLGYTTCTAVSYPRPPMRGMAVPKKNKRLRFLWTRRIPGAGGPGIIQASRSVSIEQVDKLSGERSHHMLHYALVFLLVGLVAGALGMLGVAAVATQIAWVLFLIGVVILVVHLVSGRGPRRI